MPRSQSLPTGIPPALLALWIALALAPDVRAATPPGSPPAWAARGARLSSAYERMLRDQIAAGRELPQDVVRHWDLDVPETDPTLVGGEMDLGTSAVSRVATTGLMSDVQANDKTSDATCTTTPGCAGRLLGQAETTIASLGDLVLAGWNDSKGFCPPYGAVQGYAYSVDGGGTWTDAGDVPPLPGGGRYRGDPVHTVNRKTGDFYIGGLYEGGVNGSGLAILRGHFTGGAFVVDLNTQILVGGSDFIDKPWYAADSLTGYLYVSYSRFLGGTASRIELIRSIDNGVSWSAPIILNDPSTNGAVQGSRPIVGPAGEVYVVWYEGGFPFSRHVVRRSGNFGVSFVPAQSVTNFIENSQSGAPGYRRGLAPTLPSAAIDMSAGPHRGRLHVVWDEGLYIYDAPLFAAAHVTETESNNNFAAATPFTVGNAIRGATANAADIDFFSFTGLRGQTLVCYTDSAASNTNLNFRLVCASDTSTVNNYRFLAFSLSAFPVIQFTLPADGTYYLRISSASTTTFGAYHLLTAWDTPSPGERARDHRDRFASWSDDGVAWSAPVRLNDDAPWFDGIFPEVTVDGLGDVHCYWHDFRDDPGCGATSFEYMTSSGDGGVTWGPNRRVSDFSSFWSINSCGSANQGDYQGITSEGSTVRPCWADAHLGDPDVFTEGDRFQHSSWCPPPISAGGGSTVLVSFRFANAGNVEGRFRWTLMDDNGWITSTPPSGGEITLAAGANQFLEAQIHLSGSCYPALTDTVRLVAEDLNVPGRRRTCSTVVTCAATTSVDPVPHAPALALAAPRPNPTTGRTRLGFSLAVTGAVRLALFDAAGARVRMLVDGTRAAGVYEVTWDGRGDNGRRAAPGVYQARLIASGRTVTRPLSLVR